MGDHLANARRAIVTKLQNEEEQAALAAAVVPVRAAGTRRSG
jgi:hypothetical protein